MPGDRMRLLSRRLWLLAIPVLLSPVALGALPQGKAGQRAAGSGGGLRPDASEPRGRGTEPPAARESNAEEQTVITFEREKVGVMPRTFLAYTSEEQEPGRWQVTRLGNELVMSQVTIGRDGYRLAALDGSSQDNLRAGVRLKVGKGDRAAGLAWRIRDAGNYYAARIDLGEREFVLHKFVRGNRVSLSRLHGLRLSDDAWHEIVVEHVGDRIRVWLNGIPVASERDDGLKEAGMVGFWMPADSTCHFSRLWFEPIRRN